MFGVQLKGKERATAGDGAGDDSEIRSNIVRALIAMVEIWMDPSYDLWLVGPSLESVSGYQSSFLS